jgi:hypothetical protein
LRYSGTNVRVVEVDEESVVFVVVVAVWVDVVVKLVTVALFEVDVLVVVSVDVVVSLVEVTLVEVALVEVRVVGVVVMVVAWHKNTIR